MSKNKKIFFGFLALLVLGGTGFYFWNRSKNIDSKTKEVENEIDKNPTLTEQIKTDANRKNRTFADEKKDVAKYIAKQRLNVN